MKTFILCSKLLVGAVLMVGAGFSISTAMAGPGLDYWRNLGKTESTAVVAPAAPLTHATRACTDSRLVTVTESRTILPNGRGPMQTVEVGKKLVCTSCDTPMIVMKPSLHNGRGPMAPVVIKGTHDCTKGCAVVANAD